MASAELLTELVRAHYEHDQRRFDNLLNQVIASESSAGHSNLAKRLRSLRAEGEAAPSSTRATSLARAPKDLEQVLSVGYSDTRLADLVVSSETRELLQRYVVEQRASDVLAGHGLLPRRRLLLHGPPGCGKTMTANGLAGELKLPLVRVRLEVIFSRYLGETAATLTDVFGEAKRVRGVYLFDEFDALGRTRLEDNEVGEVKRVVTTFLQLLDADTSDSLLVAATNAGGSIDRALFRRFDDVVELPGPTSEQTAELLRRLMRRWKRRPDKQMLEAAAGLSFADVRAAVDDAQKASIISGQLMPRNEEIQETLKARVTRLR